MPPSLPLLLLLLLLLPLLLLLLLLLLPPPLRCKWVLALRHTGGCIR